MHLKNIRYILSVGLLLLLITFTVAFLPPHSISDDYSLLIEDRNGNLMDAGISGDQQWRFPPGRFRLNDKYGICVRIFEDKRYLYHKGVDFLSLCRAAYSNLKQGKIVSGGSTITMQVVRLAERNPPRTFFQKAKELITALYLDFVYSKNDIFGMYSSGAPFGGNVVGAEAAAFRYFNHTAESLSWAESALLAILPNSPSAIRPDKNRHVLLQKRNRLLTRMSGKGYFDRNDYILATEEDLPDQFYAFPHFTPHLLVYARKNMKQDKPFRIQTTVDLVLQEQILKVLELHKTKLRGNHINNAAVLVLDSRTSEVLAYCGNYHDFEQTENSCHSDMIQAPRSTGSVLKPLLYCCMLDEGNILTRTLIPDVPVNIQGYAPKNFNRGYDGASPADMALARSLNVPAVKMLHIFGVEKFHSRLKTMGLKHIIQAPSHYGLSLILGGCEASLWELCGVYASMAQILHDYDSTSGKYSTLPFSSPVYLKEKNIREKKFTNSPGITGAASVFFTFRAMNEAERPGADVNWDFFSNPRKIAWKTGTSFGFRDGWAIGISHHYVVGVWVGNANGDGRPDLTGIKTAAPVMFDVFRLLKEGHSWYPAPFDDMEKIAVCRKSGYMAGPYCDIVDTVWQPRHGIHSDVCPWHQLIFTDSTGKFRVHTGCESPVNIHQKTWFILPPLIEYFYRQKNSWYIPPPAFRDDCLSQHESNTINIQMIYPQISSKIYIPLDFGSRKQQVVFEAAHRIPGTSIFWYIDETFIGETRNFHHIAVEPKPGKHLLILTDEKGEMLKVPFEILPEEK